MRPRLPGYEIALRKWLFARPNSRSEIVWGILRDLLRLRWPSYIRSGRTSSDSGAS